MDPEKGASSNASDRSILVIGGCGFVGYHITKALVQSKSWSSVYVASRNPTRNLVKGAQYRRLDIISRQDVRTLINDVRPIAIIDAAAPAARGKNKATPAQHRNGNIDGTRNLLEEAANSGHVRAFVYTSSSSIMAGEDHDLTKEDDPVLRPKDFGEAYSKTKAAADSMVLAFNGTRGLKTTSLRLSGVYGERDDQIIPGFLDGLDRGAQKTQIGDNTKRTDYLSVTNAVQAHLLALRKLLDEPEGSSTDTSRRVDGEAFFIADGQPVPFWTFSRQIWTEYGVELPDKVRIISPWMVTPFAAVVEWFFAAFTLGTREPSLYNRNVLRYLYTEQTFSIDKAKDRLGYVPVDDRRARIAGGVALERVKRLGNAIGESYSTTSEEPGFPSRQAFA